MKLMSRDNPRLTVQLHTASMTSEQFNGALNLDQHSEGPCNIGPQNVPHGVDNLEVGFRPRPRVMLRCRLEGRPELGI